jgi:hypothetical protein
MTAVTTATATAMVMLTVATVTAVNDGSIITEVEWVGFVE